MATFSTDQVRQFYVVLAKGTNLTEASVSGTLEVKGNIEDAFLSYKSPNANKPVRSDLIPLKNIEYAKASRGKTRPLGRFKVVLNPTVNGGSPIVGQEYILRIPFDFLGSYDHRQFEMASYLVKTGDTATTVLQGLKAQLDKNNLAGSTGSVVTSYITGSGATVALEIQEIKPTWVQGKKRARQLRFNVKTGLINDINGINVLWGVVTDITKTNINIVDNGEVTADMEYFYYGERADIYRNIGFPNNFDNKYLVNPNGHYDFIDITYFYAGDTEDVQKSKKSISIAVPSTGAYTITDIAADLTAKGVNVDISKL